MLMLHKQKCEDENITNLKTPNESYIYWKKHFHNNPFF